MALSGKLPVMQVEVALTTMKLWTVESTISLMKAVKIRPNYELNQLEPILSQCFQSSASSPCCDYPWEPQPMPLGSMLAMKTTIRMTTLWSAAVQVEGLQPVI